MSSLMIPVLFFLLHLLTVFLIWMTVWLSDLNRFVLNLVPQHSTSSMLIETRSWLGTMRGMWLLTCWYRKRLKRGLVGTRCSKKTPRSLSIDSVGAVSLYEYLGISNQCHKRSDWANSCQCDRIWYYSPFYNHCTLLIYHDEVSQNPSFKPDTLLHQYRRASGTAPWLSEACVQ